MNSEPIKIGIVGLGRWAKVLTRAGQKSNKLKIVSGYSRSEGSRKAFEQEFGIPTQPDMQSFLSDPEMKGVIITVPNEHHLPCAEEIAKAGKYIYTEKPIANTLENGLMIEDLEERYGVKVMVGHSSRLLKGTRMMKEAIDSGAIGQLVFMEANFSNERALELTPDTWRWYRDKAPGGPLSQLAIHQFDSLHYLGGEIESVSSMASKLSPVGAEVDDQSMTLLKFGDGKIAYVGSSWTAPGIYQIRIFGQQGLMHYEVDFCSWDTPGELHKSSLLYIQRGKDGYGKREVLDIPQGHMFVDELEMFADACNSGEMNELRARDGNVALAVVQAALKSVDNDGAVVRLRDVLHEARKNVDANDRTEAQ